jgi:hypothetical protein
MPPGTGTKQDAIDFANAGGGNFDSVTGEDRDSKTNADGYNRASLKATAAKTAARIAADKAKANPKSKTETTVNKKADESFSFSGWWDDLFSPSTEAERANEPDDPVKAALKFFGNPMGSFIPDLLEESMYGMNAEAQAQYNLLEKGARGYSDSPWNTMSEVEKISMARKPQLDKQLPHAFIDGHPTTDIQKQIAALTGGKAPGSTIYNGDGSVNIQATANTVGGSGGGGGGAGVGGTPTEAEPKWWEVGQNAPGAGAGAGAGGTYNPYDLQQEMSATPDFTGSFDPDQELMASYQPQQAMPNNLAQTSLLGNTALPSQQITGLLAPPRQEPEFNPNRFNNLLGGNS